MITAPGELTAQQQEILDWVKRYVLSAGCPPSYRQIARAMGMKYHSTAQHHLKRLQALGHVRWSHGNTETLEFLHPDGTWHPTPPPTVK